MPKLENIRELLIPGNINRQELTPKPPYLHQNQAPPKNQQNPVQDTHANYPEKQEYNPKH